MEEWRQDLIANLERKHSTNVAEARTCYLRRVEDVTKGYEIAKKIAMAIRKPVEWLAVGSFGAILVQSDDFRIAHDVAKTLRIKLTKSPETDGVNYRANIDGIPIDVFGATELPKCRLVRKVEKVTVEKVTWELDCSGESKNAKA